jgi:hypothetical protein
MEPEIQNQPAGTASVQERTTSSQERALDTHRSRFRSRLGTAFANYKKHLPYLSLTLLLWLLLTLTTAYANNWYEQPVSSGGDLTVHIPRAFKLDDPRLYSRDPVFGSSGWDLFDNRVDYLLFPAFLNVLFPIFGGIRPSLVAVSFILSLVFVIGIYGLTYYLSNDFLAAVIAALLGSLSYHALGAVQLAFVPDTVLPRNFVVALSPTILLLFLRWRTTKSLWLLYALLGLMVNLHVLASLHLILILTLTLLLTIRPLWTGLKTAFVGVCISLICAFPSAVTFLPTLSNVTTVTVDEAPVLLTRYGFAVRPAPAAIRLLGVTFLPFALSGGLGFYQALRQEHGRRAVMRVYLTLYLIVLLLPWVGQAINALTLSFTQLELLRITRYYFMLNFAPVGMLLAHWLKQRGRFQFVLAPVALIIIMAVSRLQVGAVIVQTGLEWFGMEPEISAQVPCDSEAPEMAWDWEAFSDLCSWVDANTPVEALFLAPVDWNHFRVYARRGLAVSWKGTEWPEWSTRYSTVRALYECPQAERFVNVARAYAVDYVVVMSGLTLPGLDVVYENETYRVYKAR